MLCQSLPGIHGMSPLGHHQCQELDMVEEGHLGQLLKSYVAKQLKKKLFELKPKSYRFIYIALDIMYIITVYVLLCSTKGDKAINTNKFIELKRLERNMIHVSTCVLRDFFFHKYLFRHGCCYLRWVNSYIYN